MALVGATYASPVLTDYLVKYTNPDYVGTRALPFVQVPKLQGTYTVFSKKNAFKREKTLRPSMSKAGTHDWTTSQETYACEPYAWREFMPYIDYDNAEPPVQAQMNKIDRCANTIMLDQEVRINELIFATGTYATAQKMTLTSGGTSDGYQFDQYTAGAGTLFSIIETGWSKAFRPPDADAVCLINEETWRIVKHHPDVTARITGGATKEAPGTVLLQTFAELIGADEVLVGRAKYDSTSKQSTQTNAYIWGRNMLLFYRARSASRDATQLGSTFVYNPSTTAGTVVQVPGAQNGWRARSYEDLETGGGGLWTEAEMYADEVVVGADCACLISACIGDTTPT